MTMPVLPALMDTAAAPATTLADILGELDELAIGELVASAEAAGFGAAVEEEPAADSPEEPAEEVAEEAALEGEEGAEEEAGAEGDEIAAQDVEEVAAQGFEQITTWAQGARDALGAQLDAIDGYKTAADDRFESGADPESIEPLLERANELIEQADEALDECLDAAREAEAHACASAALRLERISRVFAKLVEQAATFAETTSAPEAGFNDEPAVKLWAERTAPKPGPLSI